MSDTPNLSRIDRLQGYLAHDPGNNILAGELCDLLIEENRVADARVLVVGFLSRSPSDPHFRYRLAVIAQRENSLGEARNLLSGLVSEGIADPIVMLAWGRLQLDLGEYQGAADTLAKLGTPDTSESLRSVACFLRVRSLHHLGELNSAITLAEVLLGQPQRPDVGSALTGALASLYLDADRKEDAARLIRRAAEFGTPNAEVMMVGGFLSLGDADIQVARQQFEASLSASPNMGRAHLGLGLSYAASGDLGKAAEAIERSTREMPAHLGGWHALGWTKLLQKDLEAAEQAFGIAMEKDRNFGETYGGLAIVAALRGERDAALELIRASQKLDRQSLNAATAALLLKHGVGLDHPEFFNRALKMLEGKAIFQDADIQKIFNKLVARDPEKLLH